VNDQPPRGADNPDVEEAVRSILASPKYRDLFPAFARRIFLDELRGLLPAYSSPAARADQRDARSAVPEAAMARAVNLTRRKLHQVVGAFLPARAFVAMRRDLDRARLQAMAPDRALALRLLGSHPSTRERMPILEPLYRQIGEITGPAESILDLGCGLHPFETPWMLLAPSCKYVAVDVSARLIDLVNAWQSAIGLRPLARVADLATDLPADRFDLAYAMKLFPTLEQQGAGLAARVLATITARWVVVSYPSASLSGRDRGMARNYAAQFTSLVAGRLWAVTRLDVEGELVYVVDKSPAT
jgi:16S rRNA (guanine(1405)-N(7))-methyltransferase